MCSSARATGRSALLHGPGDAIRAPTGQIAAIRYRPKYRVRRVMADGSRALVTRFGLEHDHRDEVLGHNVTCVLEKALCLRACGRDNLLVGLLWRGGDGYAGGGATHVRREAGGQIADLLLVTPLELPAGVTADTLDRDGPEGLRGRFAPRGGDDGGGGRGEGARDDEGTSGEPCERHHDNPPGLGRLHGRHLLDIL